METNNDQSFVTKQYLIDNYCQYYKGEETNPFKNIGDNKGMLWDTERIWVVSELKEYSDDDIMRDYVHYGLLHFQEEDKTTYSYKALLFHRFCKHNYSMESSVEPFKKFYERYYCN